MKERQKTKRRMKYRRIKFKKVKKIRIINKNAQ